MLFSGFSFCDIKASAEKAQPESDEQKIAQIAGMLKYIKENVLVYDEDASIADADIDALAQAYPDDPYMPSVMQDYQNAKMYKSFAGCFGGKILAQYGIPAGAGFLDLVMAGDFIGAAKQLLPKIPGVITVTLLAGSLIDAAGACGAAGENTSAPPCSAYPPNSQYGWH